MARLICLLRTEAQLTGARIDYFVLRPNEACLLQQMLQRILGCDCPMAKQEYEDVDHAFDHSEFEPQSFPNIEHWIAASPCVPQHSPELPLLAMRSSCVVAWAGTASGTSGTGTAFGHSLKRTEHTSFRLA
ncbi:unnamed protein product [Effrenium voratum]|nr:unnamed protein product [Effrenium voratum]